MYMDIVYQSFKYMPIHTKKTVSLQKIVLEPIQLFFNPNSELKSHLIAKADSSKVLILDMVFV